jgi:uncharacterized protein (TIGR02217 family)
MTAIVIDEIRLPDHIEQGMTGGPQFNTTVHAGDAGRIITNQNWVNGRGLWSCGYGMMTKEDYSEIITFFRNRRGMARGFLFKDWTDFEIPRQIIGVGDSAETTFPIYKTYDDGIASVNRFITRPIESTITVWVNNVIETLWNLTAGGNIEFLSAPGVFNVEVQCEFDTPVMFGTDKLDLSVVYQNASSVNDFQILELIE